jgi:hypothetical protein
MESAHQEDKHTKSVTIVVNGTQHDVPKGKLTYAQVVKLAFTDYPQTPPLTYSVAYHHGKHEGVLSPGGSIEVKEEMVFDVSPTGQS